MSIALWPVVYCTGDRPVDWEHQERLGLVNRFPDARLAGARKPSCRLLAAPTMAHFDSEDARLRATQYPG